MKVDNATKQLALLSKAEKWVASLREGAKDNIYHTTNIITIDTA